MENTKDFMIRLGSVRDVEEFVNLSTAQPYSIYLDDGAHRVNGKSFMEMFTIEFAHPLRVEAGEHTDTFAHVAKKFICAA